MQQVWSALVRRCRNRPRRCRSPNAHRWGSCVTPTAGLHKDVAMLGGYQTIDIDFVANQPGLSLFHCHQQLHMDYGFMALLRTT